MQPFTSHKIPGSFQKNEYILYFEKVSYNFWFLIFECFESQSIISISLLRVYIKIISSQL